MSNEPELEQLSALVDGDLAAPGRERLLRRLGEDPELRTRWGRYHLIGDVLRGECAAGTLGDVAAQVRERVAAEPVALAPRRAPARRPAWLAPGLGLAAAASFGAVAVLLAGRIGAPVGGAPPPAVAVAPERPVQWAVVQQVPVTRWQAGSPAAETDLHRFLADHSEFAATGVKGPMPLATLVGYDSRR